MDKKSPRKYQDPKETYAQSVRSSTQKATELVKPHYYGKIDGVHVFHGTDDAHRSLVGKHIESPDDSKLQDTIEDAKSKGFPTVIIHGAPPESLRSKIHHKLGPVVEGKLGKSEVVPVRISPNVPEDWGWDNLAKAAPKAIKSRIHNFHERTLATEGKSTKTNPEEGLAIIHWNKHGGNFSVIAKKHAIAGANLDPSIERSNDHIFPHHVQITGPYKVVSHESGLHGDGGNPRTAIVARMKDIKMFHKDQMPSTGDHSPAGLDIKGGSLKVNNEPVVEGEGMLLTSHRAADTAQVTKGGKPRKSEARFPKIHVKANTIQRKLAASEAAAWESEVHDLFKSFLDSELNAEAAEKDIENIRGRLKGLHDKIKGYLDTSELDVDGESSDDREPKHSPEELKEQLDEHLHEDNIPDEVTVPGKELVEGMVEPEQECSACERPVDGCLCFSGLPKPRLEFDGKKVTIYFGKSEEWDQESRGAFIQDLKRRAGRILKRKFS